MKKIDWNSKLISSTVILLALVFNVNIGSASTKNYNDSAHIEGNNYGGVHFVNRTPIRIVNVDQKYLELENLQAVRRIEVRSAALVDSITFYCNDNSVYKVGGEGGYSKMLRFDDDEYLTGIFGRRGSAIDAIGFYTNKKKYGPYGGGGGGDFGEDSGQDPITHMKIDADWVRWGLISYFVLTDINWNC